MPAMIERLQFEVDRFELYTGLKPIRLVVAPDVLRAYLDELVYGLIQPLDGGAGYAEFNGYPVEPDPKLPVGAVVVHSECGPVYPLAPPRPVAQAGDSEASPRPWSTHAADNCRILDANRTVIVSCWRATDAALIVAAVNAEWERAQVGKAIVEQWNAGVAILKPCQRDPACDQRAGHEGPCRYEFPAGPPRLLNPAGPADLEPSGRALEFRLPPAARTSLGLSVRSTLAMNPWPQRFAAFWGQIAAVLYRYGRPPGGGLCTADRDWLK